MASDGFDELLDVARVTIRFDVLLDHIEVEPTRVRTQLPHLGCGVVDRHAALRRDERRIVHPIAVQREVRADRRGYGEVPDGRANHHEVVHGWVVADRVERRQPFQLRVASRAEPSQHPVSVHGIDHFLDVTGEAVRQRRRDLPRRARARVVDDERIHRLTQHPHHHTTRIVRSEVAESAGTRMTR